MKTQKQIAAEYGALFMPVGLDEKCGVALHTLGLKPLNALRHPPEGSVSGWYIWGGEQLSEVPDFFKPLHIEHLTDYCPEIIPFLGLGSGWRVLLAPNQKDVWFDEKLIMV